jgi:hypothetical protein
MLRNSAKVFRPGSWTGLWEMGARLRRLGVAQIRQCRAGRLSKIEHSRRPGMGSKIARNKAHSRDAGIVTLTKNRRLSSDLGGVCERISHALPDMAWSFDSVSARP